jgi:hypothetical protein
MKRECATYWGNDGGGGTMSFPLRKRWSEAALVAARGRLTAATPGLFWSGREEGGRQGQVGQKANWAGWLLGQLGGSSKKSFQIKNWIFEFIKALEICTRRFIKNFDTRIFPKFF